MKPLKAKITKTAYGQYRPSLSNKSQYEYDKPEDAADWLEYMVANGCILNHYSDVKPSGTLPVGRELERCERDLKRGIELKLNHPARGKTPEQYREECRAERAKARIRAIEAEEREARVEASGWNDTSEILKVLLGYNDSNPYSLEKFNEDFQRLKEKRERIASGTLA